MELLVTSDPTIRTTWYWGEVSKMAHILASRATLAYIPMASPTGDAVGVRAGKSLIIVFAHSKFVVRICHPVVG